jgi:hypothetical protein
MRRHETGLLVLAVVLVICAWELSSDISQPEGNLTEGEFPWSALLWQFRHTLAPPLALVGLVSAVGVLFLRAARWGRAPASAAPETGKQLEQADSVEPPLG